ncbi:stage II sporulation protein D [Vallitalea pronyensis]|uniref:Stage II sporulation protein D n=1 Tax=Vallitalea pronyensis TaxID=1348613 RepID=A0A8J8SFB9_9FIRM|nr:stage II sporulation protein D [Vallitalea pronyensis]QUI21431.1 stage II sporulation protein D [Vallitalea pronyensis]
MREKVMTILLVILIICFIPIFVTTMLRGIPKEKQDSEVVDTTVRVMVNGEEKVMALDDYLIGVVAAEMPYNFYEEALKAQAVAARTYTLKKLGDYDNLIFSNDLQAYLTEEDMENRWGTGSFAKYYSKIKKAVEDTADEVVVYQGDLIEAVFHSTSSGKTQSAKEVWGQDIPYLVSVDSAEDVNSPEYLHNSTYTLQDFTSKIKAYETDFQFYSADVASEIQIINRTPEGYVAKIQIGNKILDGEVVRKYLDLASSNFTINVTDDQIEVLCKGYGHGVGMSQYGADSLAQKGYSYKEILEYYYTGAVVSELP